MNRKRKGTRKERQVKEMLERNGAFVVRSAGSFGPFDLVALWPDRVLLVQVKAGKGPSDREMQEMTSVLPTTSYTLSKQVWIFRAREKNPHIVDVGHGGIS
jgi:Holliday junction resolvase-like predicted endonuclease